LCEFSDPVTTDRARLLDVEPEPEQPDPIAAQATIAPYLEHIDDYMRSLEVSVFQLPFLLKPASENHLEFSGISRLGISRCE
jgi:hypothetical protein